MDPLRCASKTEMNEMVVKSEKLLFFKPPKLSIAMDENSFITSRRCGRGLIFFAI